MLSEVDRDDELAYGTMLFRGKIIPNIFLIIKCWPFMEKEKKFMLATDLLVTSMFILIIAPIVITFLLAALITGFVVILWDGGDTVSESIISVMIMIHPLLGINLAILCLFILIGSYFWLLKTRNTSSDNPSEVA